MAPAVCITWFLRLFSMAPMLSVSYGGDVIETWALLPVHTRADETHTRLNGLTDCCCARTSWYKACLRSRSLSSLSFQILALVLTSASGSSGYWCLCNRNKYKFTPNSWIAKNILINLTVASGWCGGSCLSTLQRFSCPNKQFLTLLKVWVNTTDQTSS